MVAMRFLQPFSRVTSGGRFIPVVDGLRFVAIMAVVLYHLEDHFAVKNAVDAAVRSSWFHKVLHVGNAGVLLFFTISGFILAVPFIEARRANGGGVSLKHYYLRRLTRLEPPYVINLAVAFVLLVAVSGLAVQDLLAHLIASIFYLHNQVYGRMSDVNGVAWSLEIEVQFYLLAPLLAGLLFAPRPFVRRTAIAALICGLMAWKAFAPPTDPRIVLSLPGMLDYFLAGMLLADLYVTDWRGSPVRSWRWDVVGVVVWPAIVLALQSLSTAALLPALTLLAYVAAFRGTLTHAVLTRAPLVIVGGMCYTIYLYHFYIISFVSRQTLGWTAGWGHAATVTVQGLLMVPIVVIASGVLFRLFERPFMSWRPWLRRPEPAAASLAATSAG